MIVLDEHLSDARLETAISRWYRGQIVFVKMLRPRTLVKDDSIPTLLRLSKQPTFITIDWRDFWRQIQADNRYCIICFALDIKHVDEIPNLLRRVLDLAPFKTKNNRMGNVIRVTKNSIQYYRLKDSRIYTITNF
jgi:hypothetical protein